MYGSIESWCVYSSICRFMLEQFFFEKEQQLSFGILYHDWEMSVFVLDKSMHDNIVIFSYFDGFKTMVKHFSG